MKTLPALTVLVLLGGCGTAETPPPAAATTTTAPAPWKCATVLRDGMDSIAVPPSVLEQGCALDDGATATVETTACRNGSTLHVVGGRWMIAPSTVHDATLSDPAFFGPDVLRNVCLKGLR